MTAKTHSFTRLHCDGEGCSAYVDGPTAIEARQLASVSGWEFPNQLRLDGSPSKRRHDVCASCSRSFEPELTSTSKRWSVMSAEERQLVMTLRQSWHVLSQHERERIESKVAELQRHRNPPNG